MKENKRDWRAIFEGFRIALDVRKIGLAFCASLITIIAFSIVTALFGYGGQTTVAVRTLSHLSAVDAMRGQAGQEGASGLLSFAEVGEMAKAVRPDTIIEFLGEMLTSYKIKDAIMGVILVLVTLVIWAYFGGAISRIAAVEFVREERIEVTEATRFAWQRKWSYLWAPLTVFLAALAFGLCNFLGGLLASSFYYVLGAVIGITLFVYLLILFKDKLFGGKYHPGAILLGVLSVGTFVIIYYFFGKAFPKNFYIPWVGEIFAALLSVFAFVAAFFITMLAIGGGFGFGMMWPTISVEGTDSFDAISRAFSYVFSRPWKFIFYTLVTLAYGAVCILFFAGVAGVTSRLGVKLPGLALGSRVNLLLGALTWQKSVGEAGSLAVLVILLRIWLGFIRLVVLGFAGSFAITGATIIYFLMRKAVDGTELSEVYTEEEPAEEKAPAEEESAEAEEPKEEAQPEEKPDVDLSEPPSPEEPSEDKPGPD